MSFASGARRHLIAGTRTTHIACGSENSPFLRFLVVSGRGSIACPSLVSRAFRNVFVFTPSAPAIQVFIPTMGAFDRRQLIVEFGHGHLASCGWGCNGNDESA